MFKKGDVTDKETYRPISTLTNFFKIFEKLIYNQIFEFMNSKLSKYITDFQKNHNTQHALLKIIETWRSKLNCGNKIGTLLMDLLKAFDTINDNLFLFKLKAYDFNDFHLLEAILQTGTRERKLVTISVNGTKSLLGFLRV